MKFAVAVCLSAMLAACSSPGSPAVQVMPGAALAPSVLAPNTKMRLTGYYLIPSFGAVDVYGMTNGPDSSIWFTEFSANGIGKITTAGVVNVYSSAPSSQPNDIAVAHSQKRLWAGGYGGMMIATSAAGVQTDYPIGGAHIGDVVLGPDKRMWFADYGNDKIGRISASGVVTEFALPTGAVPSGMAVGRDGNFWVLDSGRHKVVKVNTGGIVLATFGRGISAGEYLNSIVAAPDGNLYFSESASSRGVHDKVARITIKGKITEIGTLPPLSYPNRLAVGKDKNVYFSIAHLQAVGKIALSTGEVTYQFLPLTSDIGTNAIVNGVDGRLWLGGAYVIYAVSY